MMMMMKEQSDGISQLSSTSLYSSIEIREAGSGHRCLMAFNAARQPIANPENPATLP